MTDRLDAFLARGVIDQRQLRAGKAFHEDWLASCRLARRTSVNQHSGLRDPRLSWSGANRDRYRRASEALNAYRRVALWACCDAGTHDGREAYDDRSVKHALAVLTVFYRL